MSCNVMQQTWSPLNGAPTNQQNMYNPRTLTQTNWIDSTVICPTVVYVRGITQDIRPMEPDASDIPFWCKKINALDLKAGAQV